MKEETCILLAGPDREILGKRIFDEKVIVFEADHRRFKRFGMFVEKAQRMDARGTTWEFMGALSNTDTQGGHAPLSIKVLWDLNQLRGIVTFRYAA